MGTEKDRRGCGSLSQKTLEACVLSDLIERLELLGSAVADGAHLALLLGSEEIGRAHV